MTRDEKNQQIRGFLERLQRIVSACHEEGDAQRILPEFFQCEQDLIFFLTDAGFHHDARLIASHAQHRAATSYSPGIHTIEDDAEFYGEQLENIRGDLRFPTHAAPVRSIAVEMFFDPATESRLRSLWDGLAAIGA